ncbi:MAG: glycosyltransferase family 2 protein [Caldilineales bacterium]|nr:glycosyltransferase family 2 protein [Caldilineales bacterium]
MTLFHLISLLVALPLVVFTLRRLLFTVVAVMTPTPPAAAPSLTAWPRLLVLIPCRNDGAILPDLIAALLDNGYPHEALRVLILDDGSTDDSPDVIARLAQPPVGWLRLWPNRGKAAALNAGLAAEPWGDVVVVYDADHRPEKGGLAALAAAFADPTVGAVSGRTEARNALASPAAYYSAVERCVHQRLTLVAKDRLHLAPAILGSHCAYRRTALEAVGGFTPGAFLEDTDLTVRLTAAGWRTRYLETVPAWDEVPATVAEYARQHRRWGRGFQDVAAAQARRVWTASLPWPVRLELFLFSLGYLDRLALLAGVGLALSDAFFGTAFDFSLWFLLTVLLVPYLQIVAVFRRIRAGRAWWFRLPLVALLFPVDVLVALHSTLDTLLRRPRRWTPTRREGSIASH